MQTRPTRKYLKKYRGFSLTELLIVISVIALLLSILSPAFSKARRSAKMTLEAVNLRNIQQGLDTYGQTNKNYFPGITSDGNVFGDVNNDQGFKGKFYASCNDDRTNHPSSAAALYLTSTAQAISMEDAGTAPAQWVSPGELGGVLGTTSQPGGGSSNGVAVDPNVVPAIAGNGLIQTPPIQNYGASAGQVTAYNNSFASLFYGKNVSFNWGGGARLNEAAVGWKSSSGSRSITLATRMTGFTDSTNWSLPFASIWTTKGSFQYQGATIRGDGSATSESYTIPKGPPWGVYYTGADANKDYGLLQYGNKQGIVVNGSLGTPTCVFGAASLFSSSNRPPEFVGAVIQNGEWIGGLLASPLN